MSVWCSALRSLLRSALRPFGVQIVGVWFGIPPANRPTLHSTRGVGFQSRSLRRARRRRQALGASHSAASLASRTGTRANHGFTLAINVGIHAAPQERQRAHALATLCSVSFTGSLAYGTAKHPDVNSGSRTDAHCHRSLCSLGLAWASARLALCPILYSRPVLRSST